MTLQNNLQLPAIIERLKRDLPLQMEQARVPGLSVALIHLGQIVWSEVSGVRRADMPEPITSETIFQAASLSKPLFAYAVLQLAEQGEIVLDRPLTQYLPTAYVPNDPLLEHITGRMVLCHLTGWPNWRSDGQPLARIRAPGERYGYSGEGFGYLQRVVEQITGQSLETFMQQTVFAPLGMSRSSYKWMAVDNVEVAVGHDSSGEPLPFFAMATPHAAASLHTTPSDYARFLCAILQPGMMPGHLSRKWRDEMLRPQIELGQGIAWGLGWGLQQTEDGWAFWHSGDNPGFKNFTLTHLETQMGIVIMTNGDSGATLWEPLLHASLGGDYPLFAWKEQRMHV